VVEKAWRTIDLKEEWFVAPISTEPQALPAIDVERNSVIPLP
jgi:hypothetical protein